MYNGVISSKDKSWILLRYFKSNPSGKNKKSINCFDDGRAHVIRSGVQKYIIDLMEKGFISCIALNGAVFMP